MGTAKAIFLIGTLSSAILFLVLTADMHEKVGALTNAQNLSAKVVAGKKVWHRYNCNDCHTILGFGGYYAPDMTRAYWRLGDAGIKAWVQNPAAFTKWRKMPKFNISAADLDDLVAFLQWTSGISNNNWPPQDEKVRPTGAPATQAKSGPALPANIRAIVSKGGCLGCHQIGGTGGAVGPALDRVGQRRNRATILKILTDPRSVNPAARMPVPPINEKDRETMADYLSRQ